MSRYAKGRRIEYEIMYMMQKKGYYVIRSAGSHGMIDVVAIRKGEVRLIQAKTKKSSLSEDIRVRRWIDQYITKEAKISVEWWARKRKKRKYDVKQFI